MAKKRGNKELYKEPYLFPFTASYTINKARHCSLCAKYRVQCGTGNDRRGSQTCAGGEGQLADEGAGRGGQSLVDTL